MRFDELPLCDAVLDGLQAMNFKEATPVQAETIPVILQKRDVIACAQTGTGKTAAFILPLLHNLQAEPHAEDKVNAIIMAPTRELAQQIDQQMEGYQGGLKMAQYFEKNQLSTQNLFMPKDYEIWSFDFYTQQNTPRKEVSLLKKGDKVLVYENDLQNITQPYKILHQETHFKITKLSLKFLNPKTRKEKLKKLYLLEILN